ncbi:MAG: holo-ACP synthase [Defluviitaleaceae bacterium]|nr:holo-ACP synthase [Defluviitaleaceae bacterium]
MILGVGVDIVKVNRFEKVSERFMARVFTMREREYLANKNLPSVAGIFAAKEAVAKALGTGFSGFSPNEVEILHDNAGKPYVELHCNAKKTAGNNTAVHISISHTATDAIAYAVCEKKIA